MEGVLMFVFVILFFAIVLYLVSSYVMMNVYKKLNYNHAWFSFIPVLGNYIMFKLIIDGYYVDKIEKVGKTEEYKEKRKSKAIVFTLLFIVLSAVIGGTVGVVESMNMPDNVETYQSTNVNLYTLPISLFIQFLGFWALLKLFPKRTDRVSFEDQSLDNLKERETILNDNKVRYVGDSSNIEGNINTDGQGQEVQEIKSVDEGSVLGKAVLYTVIDTFTLGIFQIIYAYNLTSDKHDVRFKD